VALNQTILRPAQGSASLNWAMLKGLQLQRLDEPSQDQERVIAAWQSTW